MHTATQLKSSDFAVRIEGNCATRDELLPRWDRSDRLGVVVDRPLGALGASHLIQLAITAFFDTQRSLVGEMFSYPDFYLFHLGAPRGSFSAFDFLPQHKEVLVTEGPLALLEAITDRAVTRLAVIDSSAAPVEIKLDGNGRKVRSSAEYRIRSAFAYSPAGRVEGADVTIEGSGDTTELNCRRVIDPEFLIAPLLEDPRRASDPDTRYFVKYERARAGEVNAADRHEALAAREALLTEGARVESYRRIDLDEALGLLWRSAAGV